LLAVLGLGGDATPADIVSTYRQRAKEHHPDRVPDADDATRAHHVEQMQRITAAYRALQPGPRS
jgi:DnaJ-class molecular chaperone